MRSETPHPVKTAAGAIYRKSDIAESKIDTSDLRDKSPKKDEARRSPHGDEPKSKTKKKYGGITSLMTIWQKKKQTRGQLKREGTCTKTKICSKLST